jgi:hypothetical protein
MNREGTRNTTNCNLIGILLAVLTYVSSNQKMNMASFWASVFYCTINKLKHRHYSCTQITQYPQFRITDRKQNKTQGQCNLGTQGKLMKVRNNPSFFLSIWQLELECCRSLTPRRSLEPDLKANTVYRLRACLMREVHTLESVVTMATNASSI